MGAHAQASDGALQRSRFSSHPTSYGVRVAESKRAKRSTPFAERLLRWPVYLTFALLTAVMGAVCLATMHGQARLILVTVSLVLTVGLLFYAYVAFGRRPGS